MHNRVHEQGYIVKFCHYFNNSKICPYAKFGCKFSHSDAKICKFNKSCKRKLCPYMHKLVSSDDHGESMVESSIQETNEQIDNNVSDGIEKTQNEDNEINLPEVRELN